MPTSMGESACPILEDAGFYGENPADRCMGFSFLLEMRKPTAEKPNCQFMGSVLNLERIQNL